MPDTTSRQKVLVLFGGRSSEHQVSCLSARSVLAALDRDRYDVTAVGITRDGRWVLTDGSIRTAAGQALPAVPDDSPDTVALVRSRKGPRLLRLAGDGSPRQGAYEDLGTVDVAFPILHGPYGEDGTVQGLLASVGVPYVGADVTSSSIGVDKRAMKQAFKARNLPQVPYLPMRIERFERDATGVMDEVESALRYPVFTKPARQGSSIGITLAHDREGLEQGLREAFAYDRTVIVEQGLDRPREIEVGVLGNDELQVTRPGEIVPSHEFYDFDAKYLDGSELVLPADIPSALAERIDQIAREAYRAIGCRGMARVDFFVERDETLWLNEINTIPGFTPNSMFPQLWAQEDVDYPTLCTRLLGLALEAADAEANYAP